MFRLALYMIVSGMAGGCLSAGFLYGARGAGYAGIALFILAAINIGDQLNRLNPGSEAPQRPLRVVGERERRA